MEVLDLGRRDYAEVWALQKRLAAERAEGRRGDALLFVEHPPVFTRGTSARGAPAPALPYPVYDVERGGDVTFHGPGQLVGYPILHLQERGLLVGTYLRRLEGALIAALGRMGLAAERRPGLTGVWSGGRKLASIGVAVRGWVSYHGFALNVREELAGFEAIRPCGLEASAMASVEGLLGRPVAIEEARATVLEALRAEVL